MPESFESAIVAALARGYDCRDGGDQAGAEHWFRIAVAAVAEAGATTAEQAEACGALGEILAARGAGAEAVAALRRADTLEPGQSHRLAALAEALAGLGDRTGAVEVCRRWLAHRPDSVSARLALAEHLLALADLSAATGPLREVVHLEPGNAYAAARLCGVLTALNDPLGALEAVQPAVRQAGDHAGLTFEIGRAWLALGERNRAVSFWQRCLVLDAADAAGAASALAALAADGHGFDGAAPSSAYVRALFDRYAERFDADLVGRLGYQGPELVLGAIERAFRADGGDFPVGGLDILDVGCGTGLAGVAFAPQARHLAGIDLAPRMVEHARRRGVYHRLEAGDLFEALNRERGRWDVIVAADVLTYFGDLVPVLRAMASALAPGGRIGATVERADSEAGFVITPMRRVQHGAAYLRRVACIAGLRIVSIEAAVLRTENRRPVMALVVVLAHASRSQVP